MTQEEKQLLLKDLCARLPYGVKGCNVLDDGSYGGFYFIIGSSLNCGKLKITELHRVRPFLRPMSSMTEEEIEFMDDNGFIVYKKTNDFDNVADVSDDGWDKNLVDKESFENVIDFLCSHHLDFRGLIPMGLALEAPEGMYKIN